jgi:hypothetical protein
LEEGLEALFGFAVENEGVGEYAVTGGVAGRDGFAGFGDGAAGLLSVGAGG